MIQYKNEDIKGKHMFRFALFVNDRHPYLKPLTASFREHFETLGNTYTDKRPQIVFVFGGDGTLLSAIHHFTNPGVSFLLIHDGHLGYFKEYSVNELDAFYKAFDFSSLSYEKHHFLLVRDENGKESLAANEFVMASSIQTLRFVVYINQIYFMEVRGSGICLASCFGSSGYNHSLGGALLTDDDNMALCLIAPIRNRVFHPLISSLVTGKDDSVGIEILNDADYQVAIDAGCLDNTVGRKYTISLSPKRFSLAHVKPFSPYLRMRNGFLSSGE